LKSYKVIVMK